jgi:ubiquinol-cytochrome c reductase cytochrome c1 subunit
MNKVLISLMLVLMSVVAYAEESSIPLDKMVPNLEDKASLQKGLTTFTNYCYGCHSLKYQRYERNAEDLGIPPAIYEENLIFSKDKIGSLMKIAMPEAQAKVWFGNPPPDLTLEARLRGPDWLYSYLRGFYADPKRPWGVNNAVFPNVGMPDVLADLQGVCAQKPEFGDQATTKGCTKFASPGTMTKEEYDQSIYDLVNFLVYVGEPSKLESHRIGWYVLGFLAFLFIWVYFLNKEYWKDIH